MTKGIRVIWPGERRGSTEEIEFFDGIDVHNLRSIPPFTSVNAFWPEHGETGTWVEYRVRRQTPERRGREVHLVVTYRERDNRNLVRDYGNPFYWGTNTIILREGESQGTCRWRIEESKRTVAVPWESFDVARNSARPRALYSRPTKYAQFRNMILARDGGRCVLTCIKTRAALEAAHLVPARFSQNDVPSNGIALRADLHRVFDARLFTFGENGVVTVPNEQPELSGYYRKLLRNKRLPDATYGRVRDTLNLPEFRDR